MNSKKNRNNLRKTMYIEQYRQKDEIRLLRLHLVHQENSKKRSIEEIMDSVWREQNAQENDVVNFLASFKNQVDRYPTDSINNRCLTKTYLYTVKNRYPRRRRRNGSGNREQHFTNNQKLHTRATRGLR